MSHGIHRRTEMRDIIAIRKGRSYKYVTLTLHRQTDIEIIEHTDARRVEQRMTDITSPGFGIKRKIPSASRSF